MSREGAKAFALFFLKTDGSLCANFRRLRQRVPTKSSADNTIFFLINNVRKNAYYSFKVLTAYI